MTSADRRGLTLWHVVATLPWIVAVLVARSSIGDNSFLWHITAGRLQNDAGSVLTNDPFSILRIGEPWRTQSWMADVGYAWFDDRVGLGFVPWLRLGGAILLFLVVALTAWSIARSLAAVATVAFLCALLAVPYLNPRPVLFSYVLLSLVVLVDRSPKVRWTLPSLFLLWASLHGSWVVGAAFLALSVIERREYRRIGREAPWILLATLVTAHGWGVMDYLLAFSRSSDALALISEWAPPDLLSVARMPFTVALLAMMFAAAKGGLTVRMLAFSVPIVLFGLSSSRSVLPALLMLVPVLTLTFDALFSPLRIRSLVGVRAIVAMIVVLPLVLPVTGGYDLDRFPVVLIDGLDERRVFHDDVVGGYLIYAAWPDVPVLIDDRAELFGDDLSEFVAVRAGRAGWKEYFTEHALHVAIIKDETALKELLIGEGWKETGSTEEGDWVLLEDGES